MIIILRRQPHEELGPVAGRLILFGLAMAVAAAAPLK